MVDDLRSLIVRLAALEDAARTVPVVAADDPTAAVNPELQRLIDEERVVVAKIRQLRAATVAATHGT
ncbi:MAG TPA: hypothetical protein VG502_05595 [Flexivirga sp.]|uniref:hypothetical protein n=1 Tax=Flexivirga sp. TaxID=1962927 RepID=UPI002C5FC292|nr:hypothetical protein [Flexivirga sp.]HWC21753.1 hypothetical protein [Flexivirga sp.]